MGKGKKRNKRPSTGGKDPAPVKRPRGGKSADNIPKRPFFWRVDQIDMDGPWGWSGATVEALLKTIVPKLHHYESMTWADVDGPSGSHFVATDELCTDAQKRLEEVGQEDADELFSLRIQGKLRVWGIRDVATLRVLWFDPNHTVCPSKLKRT